MPPTSIIPSCIGSIATRFLAQAQQAQVWGVTSRGFFLHLPSGWIVFLSAEPFRGPLTLNIPEFPPTLRTAAPGMTVEIRAGGIYFETMDLAIQIEPAASWSAPPLPAAPPDRAAQRWQRLDQVIQGMQNIATSDPLSAIRFQRATIGDPTRDGDIQALTGTLIQNLGLGGGLTPAGDDLALGFLLAVNRWGELLCPGLDLQPTNQALQQAAYARTSTLSANLIECAILGQADERLILALDGIITGQPEPEVCLSSLSGWGSSSGDWALQGMALAIKTFTNR